MQLPDPENTPVLGEAVNVIVPVGVLGLFVAVSVTVAVHVIALPRLSDAGVQPMAVHPIPEMGCFHRPFISFEADWCSSSPP